MNKFEINDINNLKGINVILITGEGCVSCFSMINVINNISSKFKNVNFYNLEVEDKYLEFLNKYNVRTIPSLLIIKDNELISSCHGYQPEEILEIYLESKIEDTYKK